MAIRGMGRLTLSSALMLLPPKIALPVGNAVRMLAKILDRGLDVGLGTYETGSRLVARRGG